jgi:2,3-bisphosphoglycerate-independent phosphoglycerate mutase
MVSHSLRVPSTTYCAQLSRVIREVPGGSRLAERRVLLIVLDGLGYSRDRLDTLKEDAWKSLPPTVSSLLLTQAESVLERNQGSTNRDPEGLAKDSLLPVAAENLPKNAVFDEATAQLKSLESLTAASAGTNVMDGVTEIVRAQAVKMRYVPAAAKAEHLAEIRNSNLTIPTSASGRWAGFEDVFPPVQGNSDTGHQQITNLRLAPQLPLEITESINNGSFFRNPELARIVSSAVSDQRPLNFTYLLSGVGGSDGRVHSAWNHLEAFLRLVFEVHKADPRLVHMQAILDGRDSPDTSSMTSPTDADSGSDGGYIERLEELLGCYGAGRSLAWVIGRNQAMDRDYREPNIRADYLSMTGGNTDTVKGFRDLKRTLTRLHNDGVMDGDVPAIALLHGDGQAARIGPRDSFVNLNFRADRQRAKIASLAGARDFLMRESTSRGRNWTFGWMRPELGSRHGVKAAFPNRPHRDNLLSLFPSFAPDDQYLLVGESVKELHMGYFIRGRREDPTTSTCEVRHIIPSLGEKEGVVNDADVYKVPPMRTGEITKTLVEAMSARRYPLICANLASTDMLGHLLPRHFEAAIAAYEAVDIAVGRLVKVARDFGYHVVITSDHGNIEDDTSSHSGNDVLTTVIAPHGRLAAARREVYQARLFDVSWTVGRILGVEEELKRHMAGSGDANIGGPDVGRPIIEPI